MTIVINLNKPVDNSITTQRYNAMQSDKNASLL